MHTWLPIPVKERGALQSRTGVRKRENDGRTKRGTLSQAWPARAVVPLFAQRLEYRTKLQWSGLARMSG